MKYLLAPLLILAACSSGGEAATTTTERPAAITTTEATTTTTPAPTMDPDLYAYLADTSEMTEMAEFIEQFQADYNGAPHVLAQMDVCLAVMNEHMVDETTLFSRAMAAFEGIPDPDISATFVAAQDELTTAMLACAEPNEDWGRLGPHDFDSAIQGFNEGFAMIAGED